MNILKKEKNYFYNTIHYEELTFLKEEPILYQEKVSIDESILSKFEKSVYQLRYIENLKIPDIALKLNCQVKVIYNAILRIKTKYIDVFKKH